MSKRTLTTAEMGAHLDEQLGALQRSVALFDDGYQLEARRMAVTLRVMLHSGRDPSLLKRLGRDEMDFVDSAKPFDPSNLVPTHSLVSLAFREGEISYAAKLDTELPVVLTPFVGWWEGVVFSDKQNRQMSRADVIRTAADQDGGAHVDGALRADYAALRFENSLGWLTDQDIPPSNDPGYAAIRQIAHEVLKTFISGYSKTMEDVHNVGKKSEISGGKMRFFPHEKQFFIIKTATPLMLGLTYVTEIIVDSITTGSVRMVVNSTVSEPVTLAGAHSMRIVAGPEQNTGVFGEYTDAVIARVSIKQILE